eukprot:5675764-Lingulodinium_polyedra.AAC.1
MGAESRPETISAPATPKEVAAATITRLSHQHAVLDSELDELHSSKSSPSSPGRAGGTVGQQRWQKSV